MSIEQNNIANVVQINSINYLGLENINNNLNIHYLVYKITNTLNGCYYIGQHKTTNPIDNYMGSGKYFERVVSKYPLNVFIKEILFDFDNFEDMNTKEKELVPLSACFPNNPMSYNLVEGGSGQLTDYVKIRISETLKTNGKVSGKNNPMFGYKWSDEQRKHQSELMKGRQISDAFREQCSIRYSGNGNPMFGKHHTEQSRKKISETRKCLNISKGENNHMYSLKNFTDKQKIEWKQKISKANTGKKRTTEFKKQISEKIKAQHIRRMHDPKTGKIANVPQKDIQSFLDKGYVFGTGIQSRLGKVGACTGKRIMTSPDGSKKYIKIEDIPHYIELGWKQSKRSKPIK